jgi:hypothetical protein
MKRPLFAAGLVAMPLSGALAGPLEDGMAAYNRGDYVPTLQLVTNHLQHPRLFH